MKKRFLALTLAAVLLLCGCGTASTAAGRTVSDPFGGTAELPDPVTGVIARVNTASCIAAMGKADLIKGTYKYMHNDVWADYMYPGLGDAANLTADPTAEAFYELDANLCFWSDQDCCSALREQGICALADKPEDMPATMRMLGDVFGQQDWAEKWIAYYEDTLELIRERTEGITDKKVVYYVHGAGNQGIYHTAAGGTVSERWIQESGGDYATHDTTGFGIDITPEALLEIDPDVVVIGGVYYKSMEDTFYTDPYLADLKAVQSRQIYNVPVGLIPWDQYGVEYPLLCLWTASVIYPDVFADIDIAEETQDFYKTYCGVELSDQEVEYLLAGKAPDGGELLREE